MKKVIFLMAIVGVYCVSCTSSSKSLGTVTVQDYYNGNSYAQKYLNDPHLISGDDAEIYIKAFKKHKYKVLFKGKHLDNAWSTFDRHTLDSLVNDPATDSIFFFLAAFPKKDKSVPKDSVRHPFIIMEGVSKFPVPPMGKGSAEYSSYLAQVVFFSPIKLCPPPDRGCRIPGN